MKIENKATELISGKTKFKDNRNNLEYTYMAYYPDTKLYRMTDKLNYKFYIADDIVRDFFSKI